MSTYAVFGMARHRAVEMARKSIEAVKKVNGRDVAMTSDEWEAAVQAAADATMASHRAIQLSEKFDAPRFAHEFLEIARRDGAIRLHVKVYCIQGYHEKTLKPRYGWVDESDAPAVERSRQLAESGRLSRR